MPLFEAGQIFDRYRILSWLGSGTSGESYEAEDAMLLRKVTLKLIHPQDTLPDSARRQFFREMQGISALNHPFIASVLDYGEINGRLYVARRYTSSGSLLSADGRVWFRPPLNVSDAIRYTHQIAWALHSIHVRGYVHGSVTFTNLLVLRDPSLDNQADYAPFLLADAGLAQFTRHFGQNHQAPLPVSGAPEQIGRRVTPASDQFALAVLLYTWLAGRPPFIGTPEEVARLKLTETITPLSSLNSRITIEQDGILLRALSVFPEDRYPTVLAFADALLDTITSHDSNSEATGILAQTNPDLAEEVEEVTNPQMEVVSEDEPAAITSVPTPEEAQSRAIAVDDATAPEMMAVIVDTPVGAIENEDLSAHAHVFIASPYTDDPLEVALEHDEVTVGRAGSSDILLDFDNLTSRHHALFRRENGRYILFDRQSANGVFVNGQKISSEEGYSLADGDHISIGNYELIFRCAPTAGAASENGLAPAQEEHYEITQVSS